MVGIKVKLLVLLPRSPSTILKGLKDVRSLPYMSEEVPPEARTGTAHAQDMQPRGVPPQLAPALAPQLVPAASMRCFHLRTPRHGLRPLIRDKQLPVAQAWAVYVQWGMIAWP